jgi:hypothetical protein
MDMALNKDADNGGSISSHGIIEYLYEDCE